MRRAALALVATLGACGGGQRPGPPRSTCADAAASIVRGLRATAPEHAEGAPGVGHPVEGAAALEPRFARVCGASGWRPAVVRCFALARDPGEHRVCARRLEPAQRDEARLIQSELYGPASRRGLSGGLRVDDSCRRLVPVLEALVGCDRLPPFEQLAVRNTIETLLRAAADAASSDDPVRLARVAADCEQMADVLRAALVQVGC